MMGLKERAFAPLINVSLEDLVPADHFYRHLERTLDLSFVREFVQGTYAGVGRPSIDPIVFFKLQLVMFFEGICSERQLMRHAADRLSVLWYLGYDLGEPLHDHSSLTRIRERYGVDVFRRFFEAIVEQCQQEGLVWGRELYIDATKVKANASLDPLKPRFAVEAHLANLFAAQSEKLPEERDQQMPQEDAPSSDPVEQEKVPVPVQLPTSLAQEEREALSQQNAARHDWIEELGAQDRSVTGHCYQRILISLDPLAPGSVYTASVDDQGKVGLYRLEVGCSPGAGKLKVAGGIEGPMKESIQRAFAYIHGHKANMGIEQMIDTTDFHVEAIDLLVNHIPCDAGIGLVVAVYSAIKKHAALPALLILGDLSIQGNIKAVRSLAEPLQIGMDNGARRALIPIENKRHFLDVSADIMERVDPIFYSDPMTAAVKALGMN